MAILVLGASGATGRLLVEQLLDRGCEVRIIVRSTHNIPARVARHANISVIIASVAELTECEWRHYLHDCHAVASCLGHSLSLKGIFGPPYRLVTGVTRRVCTQLRSLNPQQPVKFVLMNTTGNRNRDLDEPVSLAQRCVVGLLRVLLPPHTDNEQAADWLRTQIGSNDAALEWVAVRPDTLIDEHAVSAYSVHPSPTRSAIFDAGKSSRINVAHFIAELLTDDRTWSRWKGQMPVLYNA